MQTTLDSMIVEFDLSSRQSHVLSVQELSLKPNDLNRIYWVHCNLNELETFKILAAKLRLPEDVIDMCVHEDAMMKLLDKEDSLTIKIQYLLSLEFQNEEELNFGNLIIHLTDQVCFTATAEPIPVLYEFIDAYPKALRYAKTPCFILFLIMDIIVNDYARGLFNFELITDQIELSTHTNHQDDYHHVMHIKQQVMKVKRYATVIREILVRISGRNIAVISDQCRSFLSNLANHAHMLIHEAESTRDMLNSLLDQIDNALMQRMNEIMKVLTSFAAIFLPLSLITGIYGMNFRQMPELEWKYGYLFALGLIVICASFLIWMFKKKKWF